MTFLSFYSCLFIFWSIRIKLNLKKNIKSGRKSIPPVQSSFIRFVLRCENPNNNSLAINQIFKKTKRENVHKSTWYDYARKGERELNGPFFCVCPYDLIPEYLFFEFQYVSIRIYDLIPFPIYLNIIYIEMRFDIDRTESETDDKWQ